MPIVNRRVWRGNERSIVHAERREKSVYFDNKIFYSNKTSHRSKDRRYFFNHSRTSLFTPFLLAIEERC